MKLISRFAIVGFASLFVGLLFGYVQSERTVGKGSTILSQFLALQEYELLTSLEYKEADPAIGRKALLSLVNFMEAMETRSDVSSDVRKGIELDRGITYLRLAKLEELNGNSTGSQHYLDQAQDILRKGGMSDVSAGHLREVVSQFDSTSHYLLPYAIAFRARMN